MNVTTLVFLGLAVLWAIVLLPEAVRKVAGSRRSGDSIGSFNRQLSVLDRSGLDRSGRRPASSNVIDLASKHPQHRHGVRAAQTNGVSHTPYAVRRRRQEILTGLGAGAGLTLLCAIAFGGPFVWLHILCAILLIAYVVLLSQVTRGAARPMRRGAMAPMAQPPAAHRSVAPVRGQPLDRRIAN